MKRDNKSDDAILRQKAEGLLKERRVESRLQYSKMQAQKLIHELEVHQIELELQNEELDLAKEQAEVASRKYAELYDFAPSGYFTLSRTGEIIELNLSGAKILGKERSRLKNGLFGFFVSEETRPIFNHFLGNVFNSKVEELCEVALSANGNSLKYVQLTGIVTENGKQCFISVTDVTKRKQSEEERLEISEERYRLLYENAKIGLYRTTPDGTIVLANQALVKMLGYPSFEELAKRNIEQDGFETPNQRKAFLEKIEQTGEVENFESTWIRRDRTPVFVSESARAIRDASGKTLYYDGSVVDISKRRQAEVALIESEERYRALFETSLDGISLLDLSGKIVFANNQVVKLFGYNQPSEFIGLNGFGLIHPEDKPKMDRYFQEFMTTGVIANCEVRSVKKDGTEFIGEYSATLIKNANGEPVYMMDVVRDITGRKQVEEALRESETRYRLLFEKSADGILIADVETKKFKYANPALCRMLGYTEEELITMGVADIHPQKDLQRIMAEFESQSRGEKILAPEIPCLRKDGSIMHVDINTSVITINGRLTTVGLFRDITERKQAEEEKEKLMMQLKERVKEIRCLYSIASIIEIPNIEIGEMFTKIVEVIPSGWQYPEITCARITIGKDEYKSTNYKETKWKQVSDVTINGTKVGCIDVFYLEEKAEIDEGPFLVEERSLISAIAERIEEIITRINAEELLRQSEIKLQVIIESTADGILAIDGNGKVIKTNNRFAELWKIPPAVLNSGDDATLLNFVLEQLISPKQFLDKVQQLYNSTDEDSDTLFFKDGRIFERFSAPLILDDKIIGRVWSFRDITERKRAEEALRESEYIIQNIIDNSPSLIYILDLDGKFILANRKLGEVLNFPDEKLLGNNRDLFMPKEFADQHRGHDLQIINSGQAAIYEEEILESDGRHIYLTQKFPLFDLGGKLYAVGGISTDITERKKVEEALIESETRARALVDAIPDLIFRLNKQGVYLDFKADKKDLAFQTESIIGKKNRDIMPPEFADLVDEKIRLTLQTGQMQVFEYQLPVPNRGICDFEARMVPCSANEVIVIVRDVTERKKAEEKINMLGHAVKNSADCIAITDKDYQIIFVNDSFCKVYGFEKEEILGQPISVITSKNNLPEVGQSLYSTLAKKEVWTGEVLNKRKDGIDFPVQLSLAPIINDGGELIAIVGVLRDITERRQAEEALRDSERRYRLLIETANEGILVAQNGFLKFVNPMMQVITGFTQEELLTLPFINYIHPEDRDLIISNHLKRLKGDLDVPRYHYRFVKKDGSIRWIEMNGVMIEWEGQPATLNMLTDITERRQAEEALRRERTLLRIVIDNVPDLIYSKDQLCRKTLANLADVRHSGASSEAEVLGKDDFAFHPKEIAEKFYADDLSVIQTGQPLINKEEFAIDEKDQKKWLVTSKFPLRNEKDQIIGLVGITHDITKRKQEQDELQRERTLLRLLIDNVPDLMYTKDTACRNTLVNLADVQNMGVKQESEVLGKDDFAFFPKEMAEKFYADEQSILQTGQPLINKEEYTLNELGQERWFLTSKFPLRDQSGQIIGLAGIGRDITERRKAEEVLQLERALLRTVIDNVPDLIYSKDRLCRKTLANLVDVRALGAISEAEVLGKDDFAFYPKEMAEKFYHDDLIVIQKGEPVLNREEYLIDEKGEKMWLLTSKLPLRDKDNQIIGLVGIGRDITERKQSEEEIQLKNQQLLKLNAEKDKFFSIISHDLRNPFNSFLGLTQIMAEDLPDLTMAQVQEIAESMSKSATNLYRLLENLLQWSRMQQGSIPFNPELIQLLPVAEDCIAMVTESAKIKGIEITTAIPDKLKVFADKNMLQAVIRNLVSNAVKFTHKGGMVYISAKITKDKNVEISVSDSGIGMSQEMVSNLFRLDVQSNRKGTEDEPSTGLGLLLCKEFVEKHGGKIWVESEVGKGSTFCFTIMKKY